MFETTPDVKIKRVKDCAKMIIHSFRAKISAITKLSHKNEENQQVQDIVEQWSRSLILDDFIHGSPQLDNGWRNRPVFSPEDL